MDHSSDYGTFDPETNQLNQRENLIRHLLKCYAEYTYTKNKPETNHDIQTKIWLRRINDAKAKLAELDPVYAQQISHTVHQPNNPENRSQTDKTTIADRMNAEIHNAHARKLLQPHYTTTITPTPIPNTGNSQS